jgi:hypothetical protein
MGFAMAYVPSATLKAKTSSSNNATPGACTGARFPELAKRYSAKVADDYQRMGT